MKRFFTKKSVALILSTIVLVGFFSLNIAKAATDSNSSNVLGNALGGATDALTNLTSSTDTASSTISGAVKQSITNVINVTFNPISAMVSAPEKMIEFAKDTIGATIVLFLQMVTIPIGSFCLAIVGNILDFTLQYTIYSSGFSSMVNSIQVQSIWILIRDTANICFIFILLYAAIQQIVSGVTKKDILVSIIISAVLINFSLFITKIAIDAGNIVATSLYNQITLNTNTSGNRAQVMIRSMSGAVFDNPSGIDLSGRLMDSLRLTTLFDINNDGTVYEPGSIVGMGALLTCFTKIILILVTLFVFAVFALLLIGRFIMLLILMITSPIGFIGGTIPGIGGFTTKWRKTLVDQILIAPVLMFFILLTVRFSQILPSSTNPMIIFFNFAIIAFLLLKSASITKSMSGPMGTFVDKFSSLASGLALGAVSGGTALALRQTVGRGANALANSQHGQDLLVQSSKGGVGGWMAKRQLNLINGTAKSTFDARATNAGKGTLGMLQSNGMLINSNYVKAGGGYGKGQTGFSGWIDKQKKDAIKEGENYDKAYGEYGRRVVDEKIVEKLIQKEITIEKQIEREPNKKSELEPQLNKIREQRKSIQNDSKAAEKIQSADTDFAKAEEKIAEFNRKQKELKDKEKQIEDDKTNKLKKGELSKEEITKLNKQTEDLKKESSKLDEDLKKTEKERDDARKFMDIKNELGESILETLIEAKKMRNNFAKSIRNDFAFLRTSGENAAISRAVAKEKSDKDKEKEEKNKERAELAKEVAKEMEENKK